MQTMKTDKLVSRDLITIGIFSVIFAAITFIGAMTIGMIPMLYPFMIAIEMLPNAIIWGYLRVKVPKRWSIMIQCVIFSMIMFIVGASWWIVLSILAGGLAAEIISSMGKYKSFTLNTAGYAAFGVLFTIGSYAPILMLGDWYYENAVSKGMSTNYMDILMSFMSWPILMISLILTAVTALLGMRLGKVMLKKHFIKAGIV